MNTALKYDRLLKESEPTAPARILSFISPGSLVLEVGPATGYMTAVLKNKFNCRVHCIEIDQVAAAQAQEFCEKMIVGDIETLQLESIWPSGYFDYVIFADVLEHLRDPGAALKKVRPLLKSSGRLLSSIPNITFAAVAAELLSGRFSYRETGLLDSTHLSFFDRKRCIDVFHQAGYTFLDFEPAVVDPILSEFKLSIGSLNPTIQEALLHNPDWKVYQFVIAARPAKEGEKLEMPQLSQPAIERIPRMIVYLDSGSNFSEEESFSVSLDIDRGPIDAKINLESNAPIIRLRVDPLNIPGNFIMPKLEVINLEDHNETLLTFDNGNAHGSYDLSGEEGLRRISNNGHTKFVSLGDDPKFVFSWKDSLRTPPRRLQLSFNLEYTGLESTEDAGAEEPSKGVNKFPLSSGLSATILEQAAELSFIERQLITVRQEAEFSKARVKERDGRIKQLGSQVEALSNQVASLNRALHGVITSSSWRITEPFRRFASARRTYFPLLRFKTYEMSLHAGNDLRVEGDRFVVTGPTPAVVAYPKGGSLPSGWSLIHMKDKTDQIHSLTLYFDLGHGFTANTRVTANFAQAAPHGLLVKIPQLTQAIRLDPPRNDSSIPIFDLKVIPLGSLQLVRELARKSFALHGFSLLGLYRKIVKGWHIFRSGGLVALKARVFKDKFSPDYQEWVAKYDTLNKQDCDLITAHLATLKLRPKISIVMPVYNTPEKFLRKAIESVLSQLYYNWEFCIADDASTKSHVRKVLEEYQTKDSRIKVIYRKENGHISEASNSALELATGEYVALLDHDDELTPHALAMVVDSINSNPAADLFYSDEDKISVDGTRFNPYFKSDWNPELLLSHNFVCHLGVYRREIVNRIGGFRKDFVGAQDWDLLLRFVEQIPESNIVHIPMILYHWRTVPESTASSSAAKPYALVNAIRAMREHLERTGINGEVTEVPEFSMLRVRYELPQPSPLVSIIIPTRDRRDLLERCIESILSKSSYRNFEILVIDNGSSDPATLEYLNTGEKEKRFQVLRDNRPFNFSRLNNSAAAQAKGSILGFLNNDLELITPDWLEEMLSYFSREGVGAVGARLWYPNDTLQHGGITVGIGGVAGHAHKCFAKGDPGYFNRAALPGCFSGVTAACMLVRRQVFEKIKGFDEENLTIAFNDVDLSLRICEAGSRIVWTPYAEFYHYESASRGYETTPEKTARFEKEIVYMMQRWGDRLTNDPYYNPNLTLLTEDYGLGFPPRVRKPWARS